MAWEPPEKFYIAILRDEGRATGHEVSFDLKRFDSAKPDDTKSEDNVPRPVGVPTDFRGVLHAFNSVMNTYRNFITLTLNLAPALSSVMAGQLIGEFASAKGKKLESFSDENKTVYELDISCFREMRVIHDDARAALQGARHLPEVMLIGLIAAYDAFLSRLLKVVLVKHPETVLTSGKSIKYSDLASFASIEQARESILDSEIEDVVRQSHHDQFVWMEKTFCLELRKDLAAWPEFLEICERRNLLTHTGGIVSSKYIANCNSVGSGTERVALGQKLSVGAEYFARAVNVISEIGLKLCYVLWRKFVPDAKSRDCADSALNECCFDLIYNRAYSLAEAVLLFAVKGVKGKRVNRTLNMMVINLANAVRLQKRGEEACKLLDAEDWSNVDDTLKIGVFAVRRDIPQLVALMKKIGRDGHPNAEEYRTWPVFRGHRTNEAVAATFQEIFGEPLIVARDVSSAADKQPTESNRDQPEEPTRTVH